MDAILVEFFGTGLLTAAVAFTGDGLLIVAALAAAIAFGGKTSGGHFNPAVTVLQYLSGKVGQTKALYYVAAQVAAAVLVFLLSRFV
jgi:aquaporin Z